MKSGTRFKNVNLEGTILIDPIILPNSEFKGTSFEGSTIVHVKEVSLLPHGMNLNLNGAGKPLEREYRCDIGSTQ